MTGVPALRVLTIAGSDSSGGAGIVADIKAISDHGLRAACAITAVTAQSSSQVGHIHPVPEESLRAQLETALSDGVAAIKIGMLVDAARINCIASVLQSLSQRPPIVLDPVLRSTSGTALVKPQAVATLIELLLPLVTVATPNASEAPLLPDTACPLLITGGDIDGDMVTDVLVHEGRELQRWTGNRVAGTFRGTGCTLSSAIAARLALGSSLPQAIEGAIAYVRERMR
ncbi:MAG: hydroxymethylpyrimidine/phosphomethylpyrimidine kinase, partial [Proteobacteria bacterium]|nr:hydroxymethylpyrimidine/phosphomethylpyrimidine kinase [Pseudomonadota bacterium]